MDVAAVARHPPVRRHPFDRCLADAELGDRPRRVERFAKRVGRSLDDFLVKRRIAKRVLEPDRVEQGLGAEVADRRVMLVNGGQHHTLRRRARRLGEGRPPTIERVVVQLAEVHRHEDHGLLATP